MQQQSAVESGNVIVVGTDLGPAGEEALREALRLSRKVPRPELHVVFVLPVEGHGAMAIARLSRRLEQARSWVHGHVSEVFDADGSEIPLSEVTLHVRVGDPASSVHQVAIDHEADFIVVGTRKRNSVLRWLEGSVSQELARTAHCPVVIAHEKDYRGLTRSESVLPPRPGQDLHGATDSSEFHVPDRSSHIAGML